MFKYLFLIYILFVVSEVSLSAQVGSNSMRSALEHSNEHGGDYAMCLIKWPLFCQSSHLDADLNSKRHIEELREGC